MKNVFFRIGQYVGIIIAFPAELILSFMQGLIYYNTKGERENNE